MPSLSSFFVFFQRTCRLPDYANALPMALEAALLYSHPHLK